MKLSPFVRFFDLINSLPNLNDAFFENKLQEYRADFLDRGWVKATGYLTHHMVEYLDDTIEVEIEIDEALGIYRYQNPHRILHIITAPLWEVTMYAVNMSKWLDDMADLLKIHPKSRPNHPELAQDHVWYLGDITPPAMDVHTKIAVARCQRGAAEALIQHTLEDHFDSGDVMVLVDTVLTIKPQDEYPKRCLADFVEFSGHQNTFDHKMLNRIVQRNRSKPSEKKPHEYLDGKMLMLAHFIEPIALTETQIKIVQRAWGQQEKEPPIVSWSEVNADKKIGYTSFEDAFGGKEARANIFALVSRGKYRLRRAETKKP